MSSVDLDNPGPGFAIIIFFIAIALVGFIWVVLTQAYNPFLGILEAEFESGGSREYLADLNLVNTVWNSLPIILIIFVAIPWVIKSATQRRGF